MPQVDVGAGGVDAELDPQGSARCLGFGQAGGQGLVGVNRVTGGKEISNTAGQPARQSMTVATAVAEVIPAWACACAHGA
jgi:hypothetical protein